MQKSEKKSIRIEPNQRVIGVTSMVGDYNSHVLFMDIDSVELGSSRPPEVGCRPDNFLYRTASIECIAKLM